MQGKWVPYSNRIGDKTMWIAGRQKDTREPLHGGNIETSGGYKADKKEIAELCKKKNKEEKQNGKNE